MLQSILRMVMPRQCGLCDALTESDTGLCPTCWADTDYAFGAICTCCGVMLVGEGDGHCDDCLATPRDWDQGRTVFGYSGAGRKMVLGLKHGDRHDLVPMLSRQMARVAAPLMEPDTILLPIPLHWTRFLKRRYNQSALLAQGIAKRSAVQVIEDGLLRTVRTKTTQGMTRDERIAAQNGTIAVNPKRTAIISNRPVILIDDVMTTGATLGAAAQAVHAAGARRVCVLTLARAVKDP
ncbi:amidophosphoribosyltransferase [Marivivens niveibacter]|uniref:Amidophosphoribosyltransferase n=1 Tax=Marivivens niveibacter TaxID=1930667 RepID=A0A251WYW3_9RHOB|nr:ComF family protein [Marivivens niveibacter]OUD09669.1 amidophosphoribosyltransferase [Marivivens niveibacter]